MDGGLLAYLETSEAPRREDLLERLVIDEAAPLVRQTIRYRLRFHLSEGGRSPSNPDAEDLYHDILARLVKTINRMAGEGGLLPIRDFRQYTVRVATNGCNDYLRRKYPGRTRLRDRVRDLLLRRGDLAIWKGEESGMLCGLAAWREAPQRPDLLLRQQSLRAEPERFREERLPHDGPRAPGLARIVEEVIEWMGGPVDLDCVVEVAAFVLGVREQQYEPWEQETEDGQQRMAAESVAGAARIESGVEEELEREMRERAALKRLWMIIETLPDRQRKVFFYGFATSSGEDLLTLLFQAGVATPSQVALTMEVPLERLMAVWRAMPLCTPDLAAFLGLDRQQVSKLRFRAIRTIEKRMGEGA